MATACHFPVRESVTGHRRVRRGSAGTRLGCRERQQSRWECSGARGKVGSEVCRAVDAADDLDAGRRGSTSATRSTELVARGRPGGRRLHPPRRGHGQPRVLHRARHPRRGRHHRLRRGAPRRPCGAGSPTRPGTGVLIAPNFSIGAILMMRFAARGRAVLRLGRDRRAAPPGQGRRPLRHGAPYRRARRPQARREAGCGPMPDATSTALDGARGADVDGVRVHSVRVRGPGRPPGGAARRAGGDPDHPPRLAGPRVVHAPAC